MSSHNDVAVSPQGESALEIEALVRTCEMLLAREAGRIEEAAELRSELKDREARHATLLADAGSELKREREGSARLLDEQHRLTADLLDARSRQAQAEKDLHETSARLRYIEDRSADASSRDASLQATIHDLRNQIERLRSDLATSETMRAELLAKIETSEEHSSSLSAHYHSALADLRSARAQLASFFSELRKNSISHEQKIAELQSGFALREEEFVKLRCERDTALDRAGEKKAELARAGDLLKAEIRQSSARIASGEHVILGKSAEISRLKGMIAQVIFELDRREQHSAISKHSSATAGPGTGPHAQVGREGDELSCILRQIEALREDSQAKVECIVQAEAELQSIRHAMKIVEDDRREVTDRCARLQQQMDEFASSISRLRGETQKLIVAGSAHRVSFGSLFGSTQRAQELALLLEWVHATDQLPGKIVNATAPELSDRRGRNPYQRATNLGDLLAWNGIDFVRCAYVTVLGRQPDREGEKYYIGQLQAGRSKLRMLGQLRRSDEGRKHDPGILGLDRAIKLERRRRLPVIGGLIGLLTRDPEKEATAGLLALDGNAWSPGERTADNWATETRGTDLGEERTSKDLVAADQEHSEQSLLVPELKHLRHRSPLAKIIAKTTI